MVVVKSKDHATKKETSGKRTLPVRGAAKSQEKNDDDKLKEQNESEVVEIHDDDTVEEIQATETEDLADIGEDNGDDVVEGEGDVDGDGEDVVGEDDGDMEEEGDVEALVEEAEGEEAIANDGNEGEDKQEAKSENDAVEDEEFDFEDELKRKVKLRDGSEEFLYSRGPKYANGLWPISCHLCRYGCSTNEEGLRKHCKSVQHNRRLKKPPPRDKYMLPYFQRPSKTLDTPIKIYPGEMIEEIGEKYKDRILKPDERYHNEGKKTILLPSVKKKIEEEKIHGYNKKLPVIGLCYAAKLTDPRTRTSVYLCALCNTKIHGEAFQHFVGANHQAKYIVKHFPRLYEKVVKGLSSVADPKLQTTMVRNIFRKLYRKIENAKGLRTVTFIASNLFTKHRRRHMNNLINTKHYDEKTITITDDEVNVLIRKCINGMQFLKPDLVSLDEPGKGRREDKSMNDRKRRHEKSPPPPRSRGSADIPPAPSMKSSEPPSKGRRQGRFNDDPKDWEKYRSMIGTVLDELDKVYEEYEKNPESHPDYNQEWRAFWHRRSKELEKDKIDSRYYDFNKEWIPFWLRRLRELHAKDIVRRKFEMKRTLRLSYDARSPSPIRQRRRTRRSPSPPRQSSGNNNRYRGGNRPGGNLMDEDVLAPSEPLSVISVMRLLTALEDQLGSLGPKAVQLLSRAVLFEKGNQNPNELLLENDYQVFFMTAKEKLKGQLFANLVEPNKTQAVKNAVNDLTTILNMFEKEQQMNRQRPHQRSAGGSADSSSNAFVGTNNRGGNFHNNNQFSDNHRNQYHDNNRQYNGNNQYDSKNRQFGDTPSNQYNRSQSGPNNFGNGNQSGSTWQRGDAIRHKNDVPSGGNFPSFNNNNRLGGNSGGGNTGSGFAGGFDGSCSGSGFGNMVSGFTGGNVPGFGTRNTSSGFGGNTGGTGFGRGNPGIGFSGASSTFSGGNPSSGGFSGGNSGRYGSGNSGSGFGGGNTGGGFNTGNTGNVFSSGGFSSNSSKPSLMNLDLGSNSRDFSQAAGGSNMYDAGSYGRNRSNARY